MGAAAPLAPLLDVLEEAHGAQAPPPAVDPFELVVWENAAYLVPDARRAEVFERLRTEIGLRPGDLLAAGADRIALSIERGGMHPLRRAEKLVTAAGLAREVGDLDAVVHGALPLARRTLKRFPGIAAPGADKILLFSGAHPVFALESNGLRVLLRLGIAEEGKSYAASYKAALSALEGRLPEGGDALIRAHLLLRRHGQALCKNTKPACDRCPLAGECAFARAGA